MNKVDVHGVVKHVGPLKQSRLIFSNPQGHFKIPRRKKSLQEHHAQGSVAEETANGREARAVQRSSRLVGHEGLDV